MLISSGDAVRSTKQMANGDGNQQNPGLMIGMVWLVYGVCVAATAWVVSRVVMNHAGGLWWIVWMLWTLLVILGLLVTFRVVKRIRTAS